MPIATQGGDPLRFTDQNRAECNLKAHRAELARNRRAAKRSAGIAPPQRRPRVTVNGLRVMLGSCDGIVDDGDWSHPDAECRTAP